MSMIVRRCVVEPSAAGISWMTPEASSLRFARNHRRFAENSLKGSIHAASSRSTAKRGIRPTSDRTWNRRKLPSGWRSTSWKKPSSSSKSE